VEWHPTRLRELNGGNDDNRATYCDLIGIGRVEVGEAGRTGFGDLAPHYVTNGEHATQICK
jgi:hypothetical protein